MLLPALKLALKRVSLHPELCHVMDYAVLPAGKLFRPKLIEALSLDLHSPNQNDVLHLASALELHHAYTLVHDDLPAMDNDLIRRGKPSTHAHFGEWKAILAGDALLISSFEELMRVQHRNFRDLQKFFAWATGAKGLILGQYLDLGADGKLSIQEVVRIHELKTARLIQIATYGSYLLSTETPSFALKKTFLTLGREIGVSFQLLDDLSELTDEKISPHESQINPFLVSPTDALAALTKSHARLHRILRDHKLTHLEKMLQEYFRGMQTGLLTNMQTLEKNVKMNSELKAWITSFAAA